MGDSEPSRAGILLATILASSMAFIDLSAVNVALPSLQADLNATGPELIWIVNAYSLMLAALILIGGSLGDHVGRRRVFNVGIVLFGTASLTCGLAPISSWLIAARAFQGIWGALLIPGSLSIITATIPKRSRGSAIGTRSAFTTVTTIGGPIIGGFLASSGLWRGVFFINLPLAVGALYCAWRWVPESLVDEAKPLDVVGTGLAMLPFSFFLASLSRWSGSLADRYGARAPLTVGPIVAGIGFFLLSQPAQDSGPSQFWTAYLPAMATVGI